MMPVFSPEDGMGDDAVQLAVDPATGVLSATFGAAGAGGQPITWDTLAAAAQRQGWGPEVLDHAQAAAFVQQCRDADGPVTAAVGEVRDGAVQVDVEPDRMTALLTLAPPRGGRPASQQDIEAALAAQNVVAGIDAAAIRLALERGRCEAMPVAHGVPARPGTPTRFESLICNPLAQIHDDNAPVDYRNLGNLVLVQAGTPLVRRIAATPGTDGQDVTGQPVAAEPQPDLPFAPGLAGVAVDEQDPDVLRAAVAGAPMLVPQGALVNSVVEVEAVDLHSGNVEFDGTLRVKGDVTAGMTVRVSGDVVVGGTVEAAQIVAGGSLTVNGGIIGMAEPAPGEGPGGSRAAHIQCQGSVKARFIEHALVHAGQQVMAEREIRHSRVLAGHSVMVGPPGSQQGVITGGETCALHAVRAGTLGSMAAVPTIVRVGLDPHAQARRAVLKDERQRLEEEKSKLEKLLVFLRMNPQKAAGDVGERAHNTHAKVCAGLQGVQQQEAELERRMQPLQSAAIIAGKRFYGGCTLQVGVKVETLLEDQPGGQARLEAGELVLR